MAIDIDNHKVEIVSKVLFSRHSERLIASSLETNQGEQAETCAVNVKGCVLGKEMPVVTVEILHGGRVLARVPVCVPRPDVARQYPEAAGSEHCGFRAMIGLLGMPSEFELGVQAVFQDESRVPIGEIRVRRQPLFSGFHPAIQPLMITGWGRSGTTWLMRLLSMHPGIVIHNKYPYEARIASYSLLQMKLLSESANLLQSSCPDYFKTGTWEFKHPGNIKSINNDEEVRHWFEDIYAKQLTGFCQRTIEDFYKQVAVSQGLAAPVYFAEKCIPEQIPYQIWELYPRAREIILVRDFRDVFCSVLAFNKKRGSVGFGRENVNSDEEYIHQLRSSAMNLLQGWKCRSDRTHLLRYEDLILRPHETVKSLLEYLHLNFYSLSEVDDMIQRALIETPELHRHKTIGNGRESIGRWRREMDDRMQVLCNEALGDILLKFGYTPEYEKEIRKYTAADFNRRDDSPERRNNYGRPGYGKCFICGNTVDFQIKEGFSLREVQCPACKGTKRSRDLAGVIMKSFLHSADISLAEGLNYLADVAIYEAQASGPIHGYLSRLPKYTCSEYLDNVPPGSVGKGGIRCEDLESLSFPDDSFDLVVTQDVFEHIDNPDAAFKEIYRVLKPGGYHIFTIPFHEGADTVTRAKKENGHVISILPSVYHGDPLRQSGSLVYTDFGENILEHLKFLHMPTDIVMHEKFYPADVIPCIRDESTYNQYLAYRKRGEMLKYFLYNSVVLRSRKENNSSMAATKECRTDHKSSALSKIRVDDSGEKDMMSESMQNLKRALPQIEQVIEGLKNESLSSEASVKVGELCFSLGLYDDSRNYFEKALLSDSNNSDALNNLGVLSCQHGDYKGALNYFMNALHSNPANKEARTNLAMIYKQFPGIIATDTGNVICPCCEGSFPGFIPGGVNLRPNAQCPACGSLERHRLLWLFLKNRTNLLTDNLKVLHFAPEDIFQKKFKSMSNIEYVSADKYSPSAMVKMDITDIPYSDNTFDAILCNHVLEHIIDDRKAMRELFRVMKPGAWAILQVPIDLKRDRTFEDPAIVSPEERQRFFGQHDHVRWYGKDYGERLEEAGFKLRVDSYARSLAPDLIGKYGLVESEDIFYCSKPSADMPPIPPRNLRFMGENDEEFLEVGNKIVKALKDFTGLSEKSQVLDIGSGYGRLEHAMIRDKKINVNYTGLEILKKHLEWCKRNIENFNDKYKFVHLDIANDRYNPGGRIDPERIVFPFDDDSFDVVCLTSVFTHMYEEGIIRYLKEIKRMMRPNGKCLGTFFLLDDAWRRVQKDGKRSLDLAHRLNDHTFYLNKEDPLHAIGYDEIWLRDVPKKLGLEVVQIRNGTWAGKIDYDFLQDIVVFKKADLL